MFKLDNANVKKSFKISMRKKANFKGPKFTLKKTALGAKIYNIIEVEDICKPVNLMHTVLLGVVSNQFIEELHLIVPFFSEKFDESLLNCRDRIYQMNSLVNVVTQEMIGKKKCDDWKATEFRLFLL